jgi:hypothetical protein
MINYPPVKNSRIDGHMTLLRGLCQGLTTTWQKYEAVPRRVRISGSQTYEKLNSWLASNKEEEDEKKKKISL